MRRLVFVAISALAITGLGLYLSVFLEPAAGAVVAYPRKRTISPPSGAQLNRGHPLAYGLMAAYVMNTPATYVRDLVGTGPILTPTSSPTVTYGSMGPAILTTGGSYLDGGDPTNMAIGTKDFTFASWVRVDGGSSCNYGAIITRSTVGALTRIASLELRTDGTSQIELYDGVNNPFITGSILTNTGWRHVAGVRKAGTLYLYTDGVLSASTADTTGSLDTTTQAWRIGKAPYNGCNANAATATAMIWVGRGLTGSEVRQLYADPFGLIEPQSPQHMFGLSAPAAAAGAVWHRVRQ